MKVIESLRDFFTSFSERAKLFIIVFTFSFLAILLSLWLGGWRATSIVIIPALLGILQITKGVWTPEGGGKSKIGLASLGIALAAIVSKQYWSPIVHSLLEPLYREFPFLKDKLPSEAPSITVLIFLTLIILIVNYFARDTTAMKEHPTPIDKEFPEKGYSRLIDSFSGVLLDDLNKIDRETNWSAEIFTPLDAEVEVKTGSKRLKKVTDLLTAIRSDRRSKVFLVLGDPGSGKSVALQKLCRDLLKEIKKTGKVPLYINLREWAPEEPWTETNPPTIEHLNGFVISNLKSRGDVFTNEFLDKYFKKMFENGRLFIVLDSFDEIPAVLDVDENSRLIDSLSDVIYRFLAGAHESRGILASRIFRRPTDKFDTRTVLEIRPFSENKIVESLKKSLSYDESLITTLFSERQELIPIARNPFTAALISSYAKNHNNKLPKNQAELYSSYIMQRLNTCKETIKKRRLAIENVIAAATKIADTMLTTETLGLEASISLLKERIPDEPIEDIIYILKYARLGRLGGGDEQRFSFVHRRFNEYFVVQRLKEHPEKIPRNAIPTDSRWRDALVLYCEVADENEATRIAEFCWSEIRHMAHGNLDMRAPQYLRSIHCLRFLKEAFRARLICIDSFRRKLANFIMWQIGNPHNLLSQKLAVEAVGLLDVKKIDIALVKALKINNQWINETALRSCHYLPRLSKELHDWLRVSLESIDIFTFFRQRKEIIFSLKLSNVFSDLRKFCIWRIVDCYCLLVASFIYFLLYPVDTVRFSIMVASAWVFFKLRGVYAKGPNLSEISIRGRLISNSLMIRMIIPLAIMISLINKIRARKIDEAITFALISNLLKSNYLSATGINLLIGIPWYYIYYFLPLFRPLRPTSESLKLMASGIALSIVMISMRYILPDWLITTLLYILAPLGIVLLAYLLIKYCVYLYPEFKNLKNSQKRITQNREEISEQFKKFKTKRGRLLYVRFLQNEVKRPNGIWPGGQIPNVMNDEASTLLAQLEEKWLGLDR